MYKIFLLSIFLFACHAPDKKIDDVQNSFDTIEQVQESDTSFNNPLLKMAEPAKEESRELNKQKTPERKNEAVIIDVEIQVTRDDDYYKTPPAIISKTFQKHSGKIFFSYNYHQPETRGIGCSGGSTSFSFAVADTLAKFNFTNDELSLLDINYLVEGGLWSERSTSVKKGLITGVLLPDSTWEIKVNLFLETVNIHHETAESPFMISEIFIQ